MCERGSVCVCVFVSVTDKGERKDNVIIIFIIITSYWHVPNHLPNP